MFNEFLKRFLTNFLSYSFAFLILGFWIFDIHKFAWIPVVIFLLFIASYNSGKDISNETNKKIQKESDEFRKKYYDELRQYNQPFDNAIKKLFPQKYQDLLIEYEFRDQLRNGLVHLYTPKAKIGLFSKNDDIYFIIKNEDHPFVSTDGKLLLGIEYFYMDFTDACKKVLSMKFSADNDKMNKSLLSIPL